MVAWARPTENRNARPGRRCRTEPLPKGGADIARPLGLNRTGEAHRLVTSNDGIPLTWTSVDSTTRSNGWRRSHIG